MPNSLTLTLNFLQHVADKQTHSPFACIHKPTTSACLPPTKIIIRPTNLWEPNTGDDLIPIVGRERAHVGDEGGRDQAVAHQIAQVLVQVLHGLRPANLLTGQTADDLGSPIQLQLQTLGLVVTVERGRGKGRLRISTAMHEHTGMVGW